MDDLDEDINQDSRWKRSNVGMIVGIVAGSLAFVAIVGFIIWKWKQHRRERTFTSASAASFDPLNKMVSF